MASHGTDAIIHNNQPDDRVCKVCSRILATTSPDGDLVPAGTHDGACGTCRPFEGLHEYVQATDEAFKALESRRFDHGGRQKALEETKAAHRALDNFLLQVETQPLRKALAPDAAHRPDDADQELQHDPETKQQARKRQLTPPSVPKPKKSRLDGEARRVSFDAAVVFRDEVDGRPYEVFNRSSDAYVPGRNAPSDSSGYLDTSGYGVAPSKFFGLKRHKKGWIETKEGKEMDELWNGDVVSSDADQEGVEAQNGENAPEHTDDEVPTPAAKSVLRQEASVEALGCGLPESVPIEASRKEEGQYHPKLSTESEVAHVGGAGDGGLPHHRFSAQSHLTEHAEHTPFILPASTMGNDNQSLPDRSSVEDDESWTYGFGWNRKLSPGSRPKGIQWKPGFDDSLPQHFKQEHERRGRHM